MRYTPTECPDLPAIRTEIDALDRQIIALLGQRMGYVEAAAAFKTDSVAVQAQERVDAMLAVRRQWAEDEQLPPDIVENVYRTLVAGFIQHEMTHWQRR